MRSQKHLTNKVFSKSLFYAKILIISVLEKNRNRKGIWQTATKNIIKNKNRNSFRLLLSTFFYFYIKYSSSKVYRVEKT